MRWLLPLLFIPLVVAAGVVIENRDLTVNNGNINVNGGYVYISSQPVVVTPGGTVNTLPFFSNMSTIAPTSLYWNPTTKRLGINISNPGQTLDVNGNVRSFDYFISYIYPPDDVTPDLGGFELRVRDVGGKEKFWRIYSAPIGGGYGVTPLGFEIWEYNDPGCGGGGICTPRFRIFPGGGGRLDVGTTQLEYTGTEGMKVSKIVDRENTGYYLDPNVGGVVGPLTVGYPTAWDSLISKSSILIDVNVTNGRVSEGIRMVKSGNSFLDVGFDEGSNAFSIHTWMSTGGTVYPLRLVAGSSIVYLDPTGNVGIGTTTPSMTLDVSGDTKVRGLLSVDSTIISNTSTTSLLWGNNSRIVADQGGSIELGGDNTTAGVGTPYIDFHYNGSTSDFDVRLRITSPDVLSVEGGTLAIPSRSSCSKLYTDASGVIQCGVDAGITNITGIDPISVNVTGTTATVSLKYNSTHFTIDTDGNLTLTTPYATGSAYDGRFINEGQAAGGDLSGTYPNPTVSKIQGRPVSSASPTAGQALVWDGTQWAPTTVDTNPGDDITGSGTAGYIPKFTGTRTLGNSQIFDSGTGVGIGTTTPAYKLDVVGSVRANEYYVRGWDAVYRSIDSQTNNVYHLIGTYHGWDENGVYIAGYNAKNNASASKARKVYVGGPGSTVAVFDLMNGTMGIGTTTPQSKLDVQGNVIVRSGTGFVDTDGGALVHIGSQDAAAGTAGEAYRLAIQPYGHTGGPWNIVARDTAAKAFLDIRYGVSSSSLFTLDHLGNVGIRTNTPQFTLDVNGTGRFISTERALTISDNGGGGTPRIYIEMTKSLGAAPGIELKNVDTSTTSTIGWIARDGTIITFEYPYGTSKAYIDTLGNIVAPKLVDKDNTTYYIDPSNTTTSSVLAGKVFVKGGSNWTTNTPTITLAIGDNDTGINWGGDGVLQFYTNNAERMRLTGVGLGIGTTSPAEKLDVAGNVKASQLIDRENTAYYVDPANVSELNEVNAAVVRASLLQSGDLVFKNDFRFIEDGNEAIVLLNPQGEPILRIDVNGNLWIRGEIKRG